MNEKLITDLGGTAALDKEEKLWPHAIAGLSYRGGRLRLAGTNRVLIFSAAVRCLHSRPEHFGTPAMSFPAWSDTHPPKLIANALGFIGRHTWRFTLDAAFQIIAMLLEDDF